MSIHTRTNIQGSTKGKRDEGICIERDFSGKPHVELPPRIRNTRAADFIFETFLLSRSLPQPLVVSRKLQQHRPVECNSYGSRAKQAAVASRRVASCCTIYILIKIKSSERENTRRVAPGLWPLGALIKRGGFSRDSNLHNKFTWLCNSCVLTTGIVNHVIT